MYKDIALKAVDELIYEIGANQYSSTSKLDEAMFQVASLSAKLAERESEDGSSSVVKAADELVDGTKSLAEKTLAALALKHALSFID